MLITLIVLEEPLARDTHIDSQTDRQPASQTDRQTDRLSDRQTDS